MPSGDPGARRVALRPIGRRAARTSEGRCAATAGAATRPPRFMSSRTSRYSSHADVSARSSMSCRRTARRAALPRSRGVARRRLPAAAERAARHDHAAVAAVAAGRRRRHRRGATRARRAPHTPAPSARKSCRPELLRATSTTATPRPRRSPSARTPRPPRRTLTRRRSPRVVRAARAERWRARRRWRVVASRGVCPLMTQHESLSRSGEGGRLFEPLLGFMFRDRLSARA